MTGGNPGGGTAQARGWGKMAGSKMQERKEADKGCAGSERVHNRSFDDVPGNGLKGGVSRPARNETDQKTEKTKKKNYGGAEQGEPECSPTKASGEISSPAGEYYFANQTDLIISLRSRT